MSKVDRELDAILEFCQNFRTGYLDAVSGEADRMVTLANEINEALSGTDFATKSQSAVMKMAKDLKYAVTLGDDRVRILEKRTLEDKDELQRMERGMER